MLTTPNIVERYTPITIISKSGGIEISFQATALESGKEGDFIKVKDKNNKIFKVKLDKNGNGIL
jgi:flagella basal body P-ring formation protein FlgA